ncbi:MAG: exo-alpha-sialidase [Thermoplasmata archaeon]
MVERKVRVLIGTRKGSYIAESDIRRKNWKVRPPGHSGNDVFHFVADPRHPGTLYAAVNNGWWGPMMMRSRNWGEKWTEIAVPQTPPRSKRTAPVEAPSPEYPIKNLWHIEPGRPSEPRTMFLGVDPASLWRSDDEGESWAAVPGLNDHPTRAKWNPGAGGMCLHTILLDPERPHRMHVGISAAGTFRTDDDGDHWTPMNRGVTADFQPDRRPEVGQCVHKVAMDTGNSSILYRQDHCGIYVSRNGSESWTRVGRTLSDDFGMNVVTAPSLPGVAFFVPLDSEPRVVAGGHFQVYRWTEKDRKWSTLLGRKQWPGAYGMHREGMATDSLDPAGIYVGTTTGQLFWSADDGDRWGLIPYQFPGIQSVEVSSPVS